ncbi:hypothetical protein ANN_11173 [Periplaneta americana]|uniref:BRCT domain-containing protein n=1 Tax=Periplaneta americana TaxID=6978 RepID=A0ABQ8T5K6_PERAM|nr:hypothetical protein ANN_11173 [Periplaneta americana]
MTGALRSEKQLNVTKRGKPVAMTRDKKIEALQYKIDDLEQYQRRQCLRIFGVAEEAAEDTNKIVMVVAQGIGEDIVRSHRVGRRDNSNNRPRYIIARFVLYRKRNEVVTNKKRLKQRCQHINCIPVKSLWAYKLVADGKLRPYNMRCNLWNQYDITINNEHGTSNLSEGYQSQSPASSFRKTRSSFHTALPEERHSYHDSRIRNRRVRVPPESVNKRQRMESQKIEAKEWVGQGTAWIEMLVTLLRDLENISKDSSHTNVEVVELFDRYDKPWLHSRVRSMNARLGRALIRPNASHIDVIEVPPESVNKRQRMESQKIEAKEVCDRIIQETTYHLLDFKVVSRRNRRRRRFSAEDVSEIKLTNRFNVLETMEVDQPSLNPQQQASAEDDGRKKDTSKCWVRISDKLPGCFFRSAGLTHVTEDLVKLSSGFTKRDHIVIVGGPGNSLDRDVSYSVERDLENISKDSSHTNVEVVELFDRYDKPWLHSRSLMLAGSEFQSLGRAIVKEDEFEEVRWDGTVSIVS